MIFNFGSKSIFTRCASHPDEMRISFFSSFWGAENFATDLPVCPCPPHESRIKTFVSLPVITFFALSVFLFSFDRFPVACSSYLHLSGTFFPDPSILSFLLYFFLHWSFPIFLYFVFPFLVVVPSRLFRTEKGRLVLFLNRRIYTRKVNKKPFPVL